MQPVPPQASPDWKGTTRVPGSIDANRRERFPQHLGPGSFRYCSAHQPLSGPWLCFSVGLLLAIERDLHGVVH